VRTLERASRRVLGWAPLLAAVLGPWASARATTPDLFGMGPRAIGMGGAYVAAADDVYATFYNPAGLTRLSKSSLTVNSLFVWPELDPIRNVVVGEDGQGNALYGNVEPRVEDQTKLELAIGLPISFRILGRDTRFGVGVLMQFPAARAFTLSSRSALEPGYARYRLNMDMMFIYIGVGAEITDWLSVGAGTALLFALNGSIDLDLSMAGAPGRGDLSLSAPWNLFPTAGVQARVMKGLKLGVAYRAEHRMDVENFTVNVDAFIGTGNLMYLDLFLDLWNTAFFMPQQVIFGCAWEPDEHWTLSLEATWADWSRYRQTSLGMEIAGTLNIKGLPPIPLPMPFIECPDPGFHDTWTPRIGAEYRPDALTLRGGRLRLLPALRAGFFWQPTPVPEQTGATNMIDNDRYVYSLGVGFTLPDILGGKSVGLDAAFQHAILAGRTTRKCCEFADLGGYETRVLGYPGYESGGNVFVLSAAVNLKF